MGEEGEEEVRPPELGVVGFALGTGWRGDEEAGGIEWREGGDVAAEAAVAGADEELGEVVEGVLPRGVARVGQPAPQRRISGRHRTTVHCARIIIEIVIILTILLIRKFIYIIL